jgi:glycosyltransferase involved in cell wall biosynthesis
VKALLCHNFYQQPGGEDRVFADEARLLEARGHEVVRYTRHNDELRAGGSIRSAWSAVWSHQAHQELRDLIRRERPDVAHFHNTFPLISPSGYYAAKREGIPVVQTLHNYRLLCPNAIFFRDGRVCTDCLGRQVPWPGVLHRCYRESAAASAVVATMLGAHRTAGTWVKKVDAYIALTRFAHRKFVAGGLPEAKIVIQPHFLFDDPGVGTGRGGYALYVGRLTREKGIGTVLDAWRSDPSLPPLRVAGDGPLRGEVQAAAQAGLVHWHGWVSAEEVARLMADAVCLIFPSDWYETFGLVVLEALAAGTPAVVSATGAAAELVEPGLTGAHFRAGDATDLARQVRAVVSGSGTSNGYRSAARHRFEALYTPDSHYRALIETYQFAGAPAHRLTSHADPPPELRGARG